MKNVDNSLLFGFVVGLAVSVGIHSCQIERLERRLARAQLDVANERLRIDALGDDVAPGGTWKTIGR